MDPAAAKARVVPLRPEANENAVATTEPDAESSVARVVEKARGGDLVAWNLLYRMHYASVLRHLAALVGRRDVAEDLA